MKNRRNILRASDEALGLGLRLVLLAILLTCMTAAAIRYGSPMWFVSGDVTVGDATTAADLKLSDGSSNYAGIDTQALSTDWDISLPPPPAGNDYLLNIDTDGTMSTVDPATVGGGGASIESPDTLTSITADNATGLNYVDDSTSVANMTASNVYFFGPDFHLGPVSAGSPDYSFWFEGGSGADVEINRTTNQIGWNFNQADVNTLFSGTSGAGGTMMFLDAGTGNVGVGGTTANADLHLTGGLALGYTVQDVTFTWDKDDGSVVLLDADNADLVVTLPTASSASPFRITFIRVDATPSSFACTLDPTSTWEINGELTFDMDEQYEVVTVQGATASGGLGGSNNWTVIEHLVPSDVKPGDWYLTTSVTSTYAVLPEDEVLLVNTLGGALDVDLPAASGLAGRVITIIDSRGNFGTAACSVDPNGTELIDGTSTSLALNTNYGGVTIVSDGSGWFTVK